MTDTLPRPVLTRELRAAIRLAQYRRRRRIGWILLSSVLVLSAGGGYLVWGTTVLALDEVQVTVRNVEAGPDPTLLQQVHDAVGIPVDTPLIAVDLAAVAERVEQLPRVADASVSREWPGTLLVDVQERLPVAVVAANRSWYLLDLTGYPYRTVPEPPDGMVTVRLATPGAGDPETMASLTVARALPPDLVAQTAAVTVRSPYDITVELTDGRTVIWGGADNSPRKAQILSAVLTQPGSQFDVSDPEMVTVR